MVCAEKRDHVPTGELRDPGAAVLSHRTDVESFDLAEDAAQAVDYLLDRNYDVMLLDIHMTNQLRQPPSRTSQGIGPIPVQVS